jgi:uncharacterized membrane protein
MKLKLVKVVEEEEEEEDFQSKVVDTINRWWNVLEYYFFLAIGSFVWTYGAISILTWQKFPFHNHLLEVGAIIFIPIILLAAMLTITDRTVKPKAD